MRTILVAATTAVLTLIPVTASTGGMSSFEFEEDYVQSGESVTGRARFYTEARGAGRIENGPWHAYLIPAGGWIEPPHVPESAIDLGPIAIEDQRDGRALASITFTVPDVTPGGYPLGVCNVPCTDAYVGDLGGGWLSIARTEEGIALLRSLDQTERQLDRIRYRLARRVRGVERPLEGLRSRLDQLEGSVDLRTTQLEDRLRTALATEPERGLPWSTALFAATVVAVAGAVFLRGRRRGAPAPVPQEPPVVEWEIPEEVSART
jgi:hypothetical protein